ncbi:hypothetical protein CLCR_09871 [Cladophialophora carrionii]|uniref:Uncharacterized protein n=1 Tax=Cladophialophora carrionii TaxID=86049 RepID=A0A1C1CXH1_9EURO|nr:hypothetical protein CLCR_09871 [Cladophialophora carrionii]
MERPAKRMKITNPDVRNPRDSGSRRTEGLFTSELGMRSDETDRQILPTRTISLLDLQRQKVFGNYQHSPRPVLPRRNAGIYLLPRAPDATVTASVVQVNVNDGTTTSKVTEVPVATTGAVVSLTDVGSLTTALSLTIPGLSNSTTPTGSGTESAQETITSSTTPLPPDTSTITSVTTSSSPLPPVNGTVSIPTTSTDQRTVTVTATSTFEISLINGTIIATEPYFGVTPTGTKSTGTGSSSASRTYTFGELPSTSTGSSQGSPTSIGSDSSATSTDYFTGAAGASGADTTTPTSDPASTSSSSSDGGGGGGSSTGLTPTQQQVVGGVVGGVAGVALTLVIILFLLRWYRRRLKARGQLPEQIAARELSGGGTGEAYPMSQRSSTTPLAAVVAHGFKRLRPHSNQTLGTTVTADTTSSVPESERGFQRIAGRKIAPVIGSGADPYGGNYGAFEKDVGAGPSNIPEGGLSGASFYQDSRGFYGGPGVQTPTIPSSPITATSAAKTGEMSAATGAASSTRDFADPRVPSALNSSQASLTTPTRPEGYAVMRPSPARTPVTLSPATSSIRLPIQQPPSMDEHAPPMPVSALRDGVGRSLASQDGSRVSKSSGRSAGRFTENM